MTTKQAIEKAIEGGYEWNGEIPPMYDMLCEIVLDPLFWQCLGKGMGWKNHYHLYESGCGNGVICKLPDQHLNNYREEWGYHWHRLIDHLANGKTILDFFDGLE